MSSLVMQGSFQPLQNSAGSEWGLGGTRSEAELRDGVENSNVSLYHIKSWFSSHLLIFHFAATSGFFDLGAIDV